MTFRSVLVGTLFATLGLASAAPLQYVGHLANDQPDAALVAARTAGPSVVATGSGAVAADARQYKVGDRLPQVSVTTLDGQQFQLRAPAVTQRTVLVFLSPWCESYLATSRPGLAADCREMREKADALAGKLNARWLGVASGLWATRTELAAYRDEHKVCIALTLDDSGDLFRKFRVMTVPTVLVADEHGRIIRRLEGHAADAPSALEGAVGATRKL